MLCRQSSYAARARSSRKRGYSHYGFATPMRGKSSTCRKAFAKPSGLRPQKLGSETRIKKESVHGKSKTCRASAWQSHYTSSVDSIHSFNHLLDLREVICE